MQFILTAVATILALLIPTLVAADLPTGPKPTGTYLSPTSGHFYSFYNADIWCPSDTCGQPAAATFAKNTTYCGVPGHLVDITDSNEENELKNFLFATNPTSVPWLGLQYNTAISNWVLSDGATVATYFNWYMGNGPRNPDVIGNSCVVKVVPLDPRTTMDWDNIPCASEDIMALVEYDCAAGWTAAPVTNAPISKAPASKAPASSAPSTKRYPVNVQACLHQVFHNGHCKCGPNGMACLKKKLYRFCIKEYKLKNLLNNKKEVKTFTKKMESAFQATCAGK
jgi:hypothetical protein